jgi:hypothetical protein
MSKSRQIDVVYVDGHWLTKLDGGFLRFGSATLMELIETVQQQCPDEALLFVVDYPTIEYRLSAEAQFIEASKKSGALIIASAGEF